MNGTKLNTVWEKYFEEWVRQGGRSEEMQYGVQNFMTGVGQRMLEEQRKGAVGQVIDGKHKRVFKRYCQVGKASSRGKKYEKLTKLGSKLQLLKQLRREYTAYLTKE